VALACAALEAAAVRVAHAQLAARRTGARATQPTVAPPKAGQSVPAAMMSLDTWVVLRLRGAQLQPDSTPLVRSVVANALLPRIESVRGGTRADSLFALHYAERPGDPSLANNGAVRIVGPTGTITPVSGRIVARRPFRAPRTPQADHNQERDWRYGWAYLIVLPKAGRLAPASVFRGWMVTDTADAR